MRRALLLVLAVASFGCPNAPTGTRCRQHSECRHLPEAYCSRAELCTRVCDAAACPEGYLCSDEPRRKVCIPTCEGDSNCFEGFRCVAGAGGKVCRLADPLKELPQEQ